MTAVDWVKVAALGPLAAIALICVLLWLLSSLGLLDHDGWVLRDHTQEPEPETRRVPAAAYRESSPHELVDRAHRDAVAAAVVPLDYVPVSPDLRRKES